MKLLVITRKIDNKDGGAGFMYNWLMKLEKRTHKLSVICQERGDITGLEHMNIYSLGKEQIKDKPDLIKKIIYIYRFYKYIFRLRKRYDHVFVHMHWIYILLAGWYWRLSGRKIGFWYAHVQTVFWAKLASYFVNFIFSPSEHSFMFAAHKLRKVGHGIDTDMFKPLETRQRSGKWQLISVGRLSTVKEYEVLVEAINILVNEYGIDDFNIRMIGQPANKVDFGYVEGLKKKIKEYRIEEYFEWLGDVANKDVNRFFQESDVFLSQQPGGGFGKSVLEALACGLVCVMPTPVYNEVLGNYKEKTIFESKNPKDMADKLKGVFNWDQEQINGYRDIMIGYVKKNHNLESLMDKIVKAYEENNLHR